MRVPVYHKISSKIFNTVFILYIGQTFAIVMSDFSLTFSFCKLQNTSWKYLNWRRARVYKYVLRRRCARVYKYVLQLCGFMSTKKGLFATLMIHSLKQTFLLDVVNENTVHQTACRVVRLSADGQKGLWQTKFIVLVGFSRVFRQRRRSVGDAFSALKYSCTKGKVFVLLTYILEKIATF